MRKFLGVLFTFALIVAACGGDSGGSDEGNSGDPTVESDGTPDESTSTAQPDSNEDSESDDRSGLPPGGTGTVTVDGTTMESGWVGNCQIDEQFDPHPDDLDLTASLGGGIEALFLEISHQELPLGEDPFPYMQLRASMQLRDDSGQMVLYDDVTYIGTEDGVWYEDPDGVAAFTLAQGGELETEPLSEAPLNLGGNNAGGAIVFEDGTEVSFDLDFIEAVDCSL